MAMTAGCPLKFETLVAISYPDSSTSNITIAADDPMPGDSNFAICVAFYKRVGLPQHAR